MECKDWINKLMIFNLINPLRYFDIITTRSGFLKKKKENAKQ